MSNDVIVFSIRQYQFILPRRYVEGHQLTASEAQALNGLRTENIRNNVSGLVGRQIESLGKGELLSAATLAELQGLISQYEEKYRFATTQAKPRLSPLDEEALKLSEQIVKEEGWSSDKLGFAEEVQRVAKQEDVREAAKFKVEILRRKAMEALEDLL